MVETTRTRITAPDYFQQSAYANHDFIQLIAGEVIVSMPPIPKHQAIVREILVLLTLIARKIGGKAYDSPIEVVLDDENIYQPDVLYLAPDSACTVGEKRLQGAPELVVEVLSPGTAKHDRHTKYHAYEQHGVKEYWIVDPLHETIEVWTLGEAGTFTRQGAYTREEQFTSATLQQAISVTPLFAE